MTFKFNARWAVLTIVTLAISGWICMVFLDYVPFYLPSYCIWAGLFMLMPVGMGIIVPVKKIGLTRKRCLKMVPFLIMLIVTTYFWPPSIHTTDGEHQRLDDFLPRFQCWEYHEEVTTVPADKLKAAVPLISMSDMPMAELLLRIRFLFSREEYVPDPRPFLDFKPGHGFLVLDSSNPSERVYGLVGQPWTETMPADIRTAEQFATYDRPGHIRVAFNFRVTEKNGKGTLISTETRCMGNDPEARKILARYWRVIYPGSSIIRRVWLNAIIERAGQM